METMPERWDGPFDEGQVFNFLATMREGATVYLYRTYRGESVEEVESLGWFKKEPGARFLADTPGLGQRFEGNLVVLREAAREFAAAGAEYVVHDAQWAKPEDASTVRTVTPDLREMVRKVVEDSASGGYEPFERRKREYWMGSMYSYGLAEIALRALGYKDAPRKVLDDLAPTVEEAFKVFKERRPDLEP
ncbi:MAG: hypothetical protein M3P49_14110 [Actinomycetota bacterium]|nr:hypothetical protein [Actinomycetota bacterium]